MSGATYRESPSVRIRALKAGTEREPGRTPLRLPHYGQNPKRPLAAAGVHIARLTIA
jgi:hypothetical protein